MSFSIMTNNPYPLFDPWLAIQYPVAPMISATHPGYSEYVDDSGLRHFFTDIENYPTVDPRFVYDSPNRNFGPSKVRRKLLAFSNLDLERKLQHYVLQEEQLMSGGFPTQCENHPGYAMVFELTFRFNLPKLNPEAQEFVPAQNFICTPVYNEMSELEKKNIQLRECTRCSYHFPTNRETGDYIMPEICAHHPGKYSRSAWQCCGSSEYKQKGCSLTRYHVWTGFAAGYNGPLSGFVETVPLGELPSEKYRYGVYAIDCEMAFTKRGMDIIKISVVTLNGAILYDEYVKPLNEIVDYGSEIHGITEKQVSLAKKTLHDVQKDLLEFIHAESIILGHGVNYDLRVLRIIHKRVIDTSYVYPHAMGFPRRYSLKTLAKKVLQEDIHAAGQAHDSIEDARTAMDLMLSKLEHDLGLRT